VAGEKRIDTFLKSTAVFDAANFNAITFRSSAIKQTGPDTATVTGQFSAKGHQRSESFNVKLTRWNGKSIAFDVSGDVFRSRYDMDVGTPIYSNVVHFDMSVEGERR
jgi:polyisoprenoid-binding protein YceI